MPCLGIAPVTGQDVQGRVPGVPCIQRRTQPFRQTGDGVVAKARGGKFDGQRETIQPRTDLRNQRRIGCVQTEAVLGGNRMTPEEFHRIRRLRTFQRDRFLRHGQRERGDAVFMLAQKMKPLPAGGEHFESGAAAQEPGDQRRGGE